VVEEVGRAVTTLRPGDRVVVPFNIACGACYFCERGLTANCDRSNPNSHLVGGVYGYSHTTGGYDGGQAQYVRVPYADAGPFKIPGDMDDESVLFLSDILPTGYQAAEMGGIKEGDTVVVFGCGPVGLFAAKSAWLMGAGRVIALDWVDYRLEFARRFASVEAIDYTRLGDVVQHLRDVTDGRGPDVCIDAVGLEASGSLLHKALGMTMLQAGAANVLQWAINAVRKAGTVSIVGVYGPPWNLVPVGVAMNKGLTVRAAQCSVRRYMPHLLEHIRAGRIDARALITHRLPLDDAPKAYHLFASKQDDGLKFVLLPHGGAA
jgi:threonine dehydrogenase-like Zn-dependent dehydrogenase